MEAEAHVEEDHSQQAIPAAGPVEELFALGFASETLIRLAPAIKATRLVSYAPGDTLCTQGLAVDALYVIRDGRVKLLNYLGSGRARIVRLHNRGGIIGLDGLLDETHTHTAVAIDDVQVYQIPMQLIMPVKRKDPDTYSHLLEYLQASLQMADKWIIDFSTGSIRGRLARLLRFLVETDDYTGPCEVTLLTVEEMSEILGVTPESVSRNMAEFKRMNILQPVAADSADSNQYQCNIDRLSKEAEK